MNEQRANRFSFIDNIDKYAKRERATSFSFSFGNCTTIMPPYTHTHTRADMLQLLLTNCSVCTSIKCCVIRFDFEHAIKINSHDSVLSKLGSAEQKMAGTKYLIKVGSCLLHVIDWQPQLIVNDVKHQQKKKESRKKTTTWGKKNPCSV